MDPRGMLRNESVGNIYDSQPENTNEVTKVEDIYSKEPSPTQRFRG